MSFLIEAWCSECKQLGPVNAETGACEKCYQEARESLERLADDGKIPGTRERVPMPLWDSRERGSNVQQVPRNGAVMFALDGRKTRNIL